MITLGGKQYRVIKTSTVEHDLWMMARVADAGIRDVEVIQGESAEQFATRLTGELARSGQVLALLGGILIPDTTPDLEWTPATAAATGLALAALTDEPDKKLVLSQIASLVAGFLEAGLMSFTTTPNFSGSVDDEPVSPKTPGSPTGAH